MIDSSVIKEFFPSFQPYIKQILLGEIGISNGSIQVFDVRSGVRLPPNGGNLPPTGDRFKVLLPYGKHYIKWDVAFNSRAPKKRPDFAFNDDFLANPDEEQIAREVPSFFKWDYRNEKALLQVLSELLVMYTRHQITLLMEYERAYAEYFTLTSSLSSDNVEVLIGNGDTTKKTRTSAVGGVNFLIALNVDFSKLPPGFENLNFGTDRALLHVTFQGNDGNRITPELYLSPNLELVLGKTYSIYLPQYIVNNTCLMDYVPQVTKILQDRITGVVNIFEKRKEYFATLIDSLPGLTEYDSLTFFTGAFLLERQDFHCLLRVTLTEKFPADKPSFIFHSVYHVLDGRPYEKAATDFPYSPRWSVADMVNRAVPYCYTFIEQFQKESVEALQSDKENKN